MPYLVERRALVSGENLVDAQASFNQQTNEPVVSITIETQGGQRSQVSVQRPGTRLHHPSQFPNVQGTLRVKQQGAQDTGPRGPEQVFSEGFHVPDFASFEAISGTKMKG